MENSVMIKETPWKVVLKFALPLMGANILQQLYNTADTLIIGNFESQQALSAVGSCAYLTGFYLAIALGFSTGAGVLSAQAVGARDYNRLIKTVNTGIKLLLIIGIIITMAAIFGNPLWLRYVICVPESIYVTASKYMLFYSIGLIFQFGYNVIATILRSMGDSRSSLYFLVAAALLNIVLDILFVVVFHWSAAGVALSTSLSQLICMIFSYLYMVRKYPEFKLSRSINLDKAITARILKLGLPMTIQQIVVSCGFMLLQSMVNAYGIIMTASYTVACRLEVFMLVPLGTIASTMSTYCGQNFGAGLYDRITTGAHQAVFMGLILASIIGTAVYLNTDLLISMFGLNPEAATFCCMHIQVVCFDLLIYATYQPLIGLFQGVGKGQYSMLMSISELSLRLLGAMILKSHLEEASIWWNEPIAFFAAGLLAYGLYFFSDWKGEKSELKSLQIAKCQESSFINTEF